MRWIITGTIVMMAVLSSPGCGDNPSNPSNPGVEIRPHKVDSLTRNDSRTNQVTIYGNWLYFHLTDMNGVPIARANTLVEIMVYDAYTGPKPPNRPEDEADLWADEQPTSATGYGHVGDWRPQRINEAHIFVRKTDANGEIRIPVFLELEPNSDGTYPRWQSNQFLYGIYVVARIKQRGTTYNYAGYAWGSGATTAPWFAQQPMRFEVNENSWEKKLQFIDLNNNHGDGNEEAGGGSPNNVVALADSPASCAGCRFEYSDEDDDLSFACYDLCPADPEKSEPGLCGCGFSDWDDADNDGVVDCLDQCPGNPAANLAPCPAWGDNDGDSDVDMRDFAALQRCVNNWVGYLPAECAIWDLDQDGLVTVTLEVAQFTACASGPAIPATACRETLAPLAP